MIPFLYVYSTSIKCKYTITQSYLYTVAQRVREINPSYPRQLFDIVLCCYVLNVVTPAERQLIAETLLRILQPQGTLIIGVREDTESIRPDWMEFEDGFVTPRGTFQAFFTNGVEKLQLLFSHCYITRIGRATYLIRKNNAGGRSE